MCNGVEEHALTGTRPCTMVLLCPIITRTPEVKIFASIGIEKHTPLPQIPTTMVVCCMLQKWNQGQPMSYNIHQTVSSLAFFAMLPKMFHQITEMGKSGHTGVRELAMQIRTFSSTKDLWQYHIIP